MEWYVLCLVTLTDLQTRRAGLSASAELLVKTYSAFCNFSTLSFCLSTWYVNVVLSRFMSLNYVLYMYCSNIIVITIIIVKLFLHLNL